MAIAIITGASSGIGLEFAKQLDLIGLDELWLIARREERLKKIDKELKTKCRLLPLDLLNSNSFEIIDNLLKKESPSIEYVVNCAGFGLRGEFSEMPIKDQLDMIDLNVKALVTLTYISLPFMKEGSAFVQVSSIAGFGPLGGFNVYAASKSFVNWFSIGLAAELEHKGIHSIAVCPGPVSTEFGEISRKFSNRKKKMFNKKASPDLVVKKALKDVTRKKTFSIYGVSQRFLIFITKIISPKIIAKVSGKYVYKKEKS